MPHPWHIMKEDVFDIKLKIKISSDVNRGIG